MKIKCFTVGLFQTNMYILSNAYNEALIVDPACQTPAEQQAVSRYIEQEKLRVCALIATHGHLDHLWGAAWASEQFQMPLLLQMLHLQILLPSVLYRIHQGFHPAVLMDM